ncbi:MAG: hypothetical protein JW969_09815, partial [Spirochaetales bacterium]|nr:hypothetical protein [Spirochaetales bacterium]
VSGASEIEFALERNIKVLKFFPAETGGGVAFLKALSAPFPDVNFIATGGVSLSNLKSYLEYDRIWACGGSFMATREQLDSGQWDAVRNSVRTAIKIMLGFSIEGITAEDKNMQAVFPALFVTPENTQDKTVFIKTMNLTRTTAYLKRKGIPFTEAGERLILKQEVNGQAVVIARQG